MRLHSSPVCTFLNWSAIYSSNTYSASTFCALTPFGLQPHPFLLLLPRYTCIPIATEACCFWFYYLLAFQIKCGLEKGLCHYRPDKPAQHSLGARVGSAAGTISHIPIPKRRMDALCPARIFLSAPKKLGSLQAYFWNRSIYMQACFFEGGRWPCAFWVIETES